MKQTDAVEFFSLVIPAKAGIHLLFDRKSECIPAFAGMTCLLLAVGVVTLLNGCASTEKKENPIGFTVGDNLHLISEAVVYTCAQDKSWPDKSTDMCLARKGDPSFGMTAKYAGDKNLIVEKVRLLRTVDTQHSIIKIKELSGGNDYWVSDWDIPRLFDKRHSL
jgi:hypothetical protein